MKASMLVVRITLAFFVAITLPGSGVARADVDPAQAADLERTVDSVVGNIVPNVFRNARATYLEGYGVIVTIEVALDVPRHPFSAAREPADVRASALERVRSIRQQSIDLLGKQAPAIDGLASDERVTVVVYTVNPNPVDLPDLPSQIVVSVSKGDAVALASGALTAAAFAQRVEVRED